MKITNEVQCPNCFLWNGMHTVDCPTKLNKQQLLVLMDKKNFKEEKKEPVTKLGKALFMSTKEDWATPDEFFNKMNERFHFTLDVCATERNTKCKRFFSPITNGLLQSWGNNVCWMNPPYGRKIGQWMKKAYEESLKGATVVCLIPARTDTQWFHAYILGKAKIEFIKGRLKFKGATNVAPFPSLLIIYEPVRKQLIFK